MSTDGEEELQLEIGHVLFIDIVGYSKLMIDEQREVQQELNELVRSTVQFRASDADGKLTRLPTGDGMALVFRDRMEAPLRCAIELSKALRSRSDFQVRMGIHSGPVSEVTDVNDRSNVAGAGINMAQRVMDCGDAGHILLSRRVAEDLGQYRQWRPQFHDLGECAVKHGVVVSVVNLYTDEVGNPAIPEKLKAAKEREVAAAQLARPSPPKNRWLVIGLLALGLAVTALIFRTVGTERRSVRADGAHDRDGRPSGPSLPAPEKSIAVLPFENLSSDKENAYFADGIQDEILTRLSKIADLKVISRTSTQHYKSAPENLPEIASQLGVAHILEGSVQKSGDAVRVNVQLIKAANDSHLWADTYDRKLTDVFLVESEVSKAIAEQLQAHISGKEAQVISAKLTNNTAAYDAYLRGRAFSSGVTTDRCKAEGAIRSYQEAVKLDPNFVLAWAYLSCTQSSFYWSGFDGTPARLTAAREAVDHALKLAPDLAETHLALGYFRYYGQRDFTGALAEFQQAEKGLPNNVDVMTAITLIQRRLGHWDESIAAGRHAVELDPRNFDGYNSLAVDYLAVRRFPDALGVANNLLAFDPTNTTALGLKAFALFAMGNLDAVESVLANPGASLAIRGELALKTRRYAEAAEILAKGVAEKPGDDETEMLLMLGLAQQRAGNTAAARTAYQKAAEAFKRKLELVAADASPAAELYSGLGIAHAGLGEAASAVAEGQKAMAMQPSSEDPFEGPIREEAMAVIYALLGDADHAIPILQRLARVNAPTEITPALLRLSTVWDRIRDDPRFLKLCEEKKP